MGSLAPDRSILDRLMIDYYYYSRVLLLLD